MSKTAYRVRNWRQYNKALVRRGDLTFWFSEKVIDTWHQVSPSSHGNQKYSDIAIITGLTIRQLFRTSLRMTQGLVESLSKMMQWHITSPDYSTFCRRSKTLDVKLDVGCHQMPRHVLVDSTGVQVFGESEWKQHKYGVASVHYQKWRKLHIAMDANNQMILAAKMTESVRLDGNILPELFRQITGPIGQITGDGAYDKKNCYETAYRRQAKPVFPPQHNACVQRNKYKKTIALLARDEVIRQVGRGPERPERLRRWKIANNYHRRSLVETMMFRMKMLFGDEMRSRSWKNQVTDLMIRCRAINQINLLGLPLSEPC